MKRALLTILIVSLVGCSNASEVAEEPTSTTAVAAGAPTTETPATTTTTTTSPPGDPVGEQVWSAADAERHVTNFLAALAAGAYEQAAWSAENNGVSFSGQADSETAAEALERLCADGACAGPYEVQADAPGLMNTSSGQASSTVTVIHLTTGQAGTVRLGTFEGQLIISDVPPLVRSAGGPSLVERLFGGDVPDRVVVARFDALEIWEDGRSEWVTNWWADDAVQLEGEVLAGYQVVAGVREPQAEYGGGAWARLMTRDGEVLMLEQSDAAGWRMFEVVSGDPRPTPIPFEERSDGEYVWFAERGGTVVAGTGDAEGNLTSLTTLHGVDLLGDDYAGHLALSTNGERVAYVDHRDPAALSHFWSPVVVVKDTSTGVELGRWTLESPVLRLEFAESWLVVAEADSDTVGGGTPHQVALVAIDVKTGAIDRVETRTRVFLPA